MAKKKSDDGSSLNIVYIHGIGNKEAPAELKKTWDVALFSREVGSATRMAYWADLFHAEPLRNKDKGVRAVEMRSTRALEPDELAPYGPESEAFAAKLQARLERENALDSGASGRRRTRILPNPLRKPFTKFITEQFVRDVAAYFYDADTRREMQQRLLDALVPERGPYLLISHSMGTVISYDVLHMLADKGRPVRHWITIGSPLGLDEVKDNIHKPRTAPPGVVTWRNYSDRLDPIALDARLSDDFKADGILEEEFVENPDRAFLSFWSAHSIRGYLATAPIQKHVKDLIGPVAKVLARRSVVSHDVVSAMTDQRERVEVLIELDERVDGETLTVKREKVIDYIRKIASAGGDKTIDPLRHYVAASLSAKEIDKLAAAHEQLGVFRVWRNSVKRALVASTARALQANTARSGYLADGNGIAWAVLDTGVRADHPHFQQHRNIRGHYDCTKPGQPPIAGKGIDRDGHGTHVCGIVAGEGLGPFEHLAGMAPKCGLHVYKVLDDDGYGNDSWIIKALDHIASVNEEAGRLVIHGVNLSLGGPFDSTVYACGFSPICKELYRLCRRGVVVCVAAGNEGQLAVETSEGEMDLQFDVSIGDPANLDEAIAVGSVHKDQPHRYGISYFSSRGPTADGRQKPDVVAPGERIVSANVEYLSSDPESAYVEMSGTSMACPAISGLIASFLSVRKEYIGRPEEVKRLLMKHSTDLGRDRYHQGAGMANLVRMFLET